MYTRVNSCVDRLNAESSFMADVWGSPSAISLRCLKSRLCMTSQAVFRLSLQLARVAAEVGQMSPLYSTTPLQVILCNHDTFL